jgi:hypothetical protein
MGDSFVRGFPVNQVKSANANGSFLLGSLAWKGDAPGCEAATDASTFASSRFADAAGEVVAAVARTG